MEEINIHQLIKERFAKLPPKLQEAITSTEVAEKLRALSQKYRLHIDQGQILENETYMVLLGVEDVGKYEENLKKELEISDENANKIANDVSKEIFLSIRDTLKESTTPANNSINKTDTNDIPTKTSIGVLPVNEQNKLNSVIKNQSKKLEISPTKKYTIDPYREPLE